LLGGFRAADPFALMGVGGFDPEQVGMATLGRQATVETLPTGHQTLSILIVLTQDRLRKPASTEGTPDAIGSHKAIGGTHPLFAHSGGQELQSLLLTNDVLWDP